ncbi:MAG: AmmeMemoRadiSam system radical SAM enzyme [Thermodesulfobacteriota bacterium]
MEALLYERLKGNKVRCDLCSHRCVISDGDRGRCGVRENRSGTLESLVYGRLIARHIDPIEKKPIFHLAPGSRSYSIATVGCNFTCRFCQNADIAQMPADHNGRIVGEPVLPAVIVEEAAETGCRSIAYTYTEPTVYFEYALDTARLARARGLKNVFVTNGYMSAEAIEMAAPFLDAANVDLKAFRDDFYREYCGARLEPVKATLVDMKKRGILVEITTLLIPGLNDDPRELAALADFIVTSLGPETPWHISRFHPTYRLTDRPATPLAGILEARDIGLAAGLAHVYCGNTPGEKGESTFCGACGGLLIERYGYTIRQNRIAAGRCPACQSSIHGVELS